MKPGFEVSPTRQPGSAEQREDGKKGEAVKRHIPLKKTVRIPVSRARFARHVSAGSPSTTDHGSKREGVAGGDRKEDRRTRCEEPTTGEHSRKNKKKTRKNMLSGAAGLRLPCPRDRRCEGRPAQLEEIGVEVVSGEPLPGCRQGDNAEHAALPYLRA